MDKRLEQNRMPEGRMTAKNLREINRRAKEKYGDDYSKMGLKQIIDENPDWVEELDLPLNWRGILVTSEKSLQGIEAAAEIHAAIETSRENFMDKTSGEKRDSVPPV